MRWIRQLLARIRYRRFDADLREELETHQSLKEASLAARGLSPEEARQQARRALGNVTLQRENARAVWIARWLEGLLQDLRDAVRSLRRSPGFVLTVLLTLGVSLGLNLSLFTMFNTVALRAWNVRDPGSVVVPFRRPVGTQGFAAWMPYAEFEHLRERATLVAVIARERGSGRVYYGDTQENDYVQMLGVSWDLFDVLGIGMAAGKGFDATQDRPDAPGVAAVLGHAFARARFGSAEAAIGQHLPVGSARTVVTVVGVVRRGFTGFDLEIEPGLYVPLAFFPLVDPDSDGPETPLERSVSVAARLRHGVTRRQAEAELNALDQQFRTANGLEGTGLILTGTRPVGQPGQVGAFVPMFASFGAALLLVLILSCANVGNLQLARALARRHEIGVRLSLGAGRGRLVRQLLTEALCLSLAAGFVGFGLAWIVPRVVMQLAGEGEEDIVFTPDLTVFAFAIGLALLSSALFALAPALRTTRTAGSIAPQARAGVDRRGRSLRSLLLAAQIALSLTLLAGAGLLTRAIMRAHAIDLGFNSGGTATARLALPEELGTRAALADVRARLEAALAASGLGPVGLLNNVPPLSDQMFEASVRRPDETEAWDRRARDRPMSPAAFDVLGLEFVAGRPYRDDPNAREAVVNETLAGMLFGGATAVGRTVLAEPPIANADHEPYVITGVVRDSYFTTPTEVVPVFHSPAVMRRSALLVYRTDQPDATARLRALVERIDPRIGVTVTPVTAGIDRALEANRFAAGLAWAIGVLGLTLATIGVFGVFAYAVEERRREIGIRLALGARARDVTRTLFVANRWAVGGGVAAGLLLSVAGGFVLRGYLFGLSPLDPVAYASVTALLVLAAGVATVVPSRRALRVDPAVTLKTE